MTRTLIERPTATPTYDAHAGEPLPRVLVACPDARPPAYQAAAGLAGAGRLDRFVTGFYYGGHGPISSVARAYFPCQFLKARKLLKRRRDPRIPASRVVSTPLYDIALALEARLPRLRARLARLRTDFFDRRVARIVKRTRPDVVFLFSDVGSVHTFDACRRLGIPTVLSMVTGEVREERRLLEDEARLSPDFFPLYLGGGAIDRESMDFLHARRLAELPKADLVLVPSRHIADALVREGLAPDVVRVVPYAADAGRFRPAPKPIAEGCTFLFAGGIAQRKGIKYLLDAWMRIKRPGWRLQLLGGLPSDLGPLRPYLEHVEHLGRVGHAEVAAKMATADVFVFPSLFEGSAVVTYEALACGLPTVATPNSGAVAREGVDGFLVPIRDVDALADRMTRLGESPELRARMGGSARERALEFDWPRYHASVLDAVESLVKPGRGD